MSARRHAAAALAAACLTVVGPPAALADHHQKSIFQDDAYLVYSSTATVNRTLGMLRSLGVQEVRVTIKWSVIAPDATSTKRPARFDATDPASYPAAVWRPYDRLVELAGRRGIGVVFNLTAPGPLWAMLPGAPAAVAADHWVPSPTEFLWFVEAVGRRYSGGYDRIPRVHAWSVWNEPNQPGWLAPQWRPAAGAQVPASPVLYRGYVEAAWQGLSLTGHPVSRDTFLIGELAPEGSRAPGEYLSMRPMPFLRALYCVDDAYRPLRGSAAAVLRCPTGGKSSAFVKANPGLFFASGFAHHPYYFFHPPSLHATDPEIVPMADLGRLERGLDRAFTAYGIRRRLPIFITEYGYQTNPPDPYQLVTPAQQAAYLNEADYIAWRDPRVRSVAQFLLYDSAPNQAYPSSALQYWDTFQTGLLLASGRAKPALAAYRMPIWIPQPRLRRGAPVFVWGQLRPESNGGSQLVEIQWRPAHGRFATIAITRTTARSGYFTAGVRPPGTGQIQILWEPRRGVGLTSRSVAISVRP